MSQPSQNSRPKDLQPILLVEDEEHDVFFMQLALETAQVAHPLAVATDGQQAIDYLKGAGKYANRQAHPLPCLVLLDLRLPYVPGLEVLQWIREQPALARLPVIICSASDQDRDVETAYAWGANGYVIKPTAPSDLAEIVRRIKKYFLERAGPPEGCEEWLAVNVPRPSGASVGAAEQNAGTTSPEVKNQVS